MRDIKACFDRIDYECLCRHVPMDEEVLRKWLIAGFVEDDVYFLSNPLDGRKTMDLNDLDAYLIQVGDGAYNTYILLR